MKGYEKYMYTDITNGRCDLISKQSTTQFPTIVEFTRDISKVVTWDRKQVQTVGHNWPLSGPLTQHQREKMERIGLCLACHQDIPDRNIPVSKLTKVGDWLGLIPHTDEEHMKLLNKDLNWAAITRILIPTFGTVLIIGFFFYWRKRKLSMKLKKIMVYEFTR